jgi:hypothetical protein
LDEDHPDLKEGVYGGVPVGQEGAVSEEEDLTASAEAAVEISVEAAPQETGNKTINDGLIYKEGV